MSGLPEPSHPGPEHGISALSFGLVLLLWGIFLYFYPPSADLPSWLQTIALFLAFVCFVLGAIVAGAGISDVRQSQFMTHFGISLALAVIAYGFYFVANRSVDRPEVSLAARLAVIPAALAAIFMFGESISQLLTGRSSTQGEEPKLSTDVPPANLIVPQTDGAARFERIAGAAIAVISLAAAIMALINELRRGL
jgi:hypothetical protein